MRNAYRIAVLALFFSSNAQAFDPFTAMMVASTAINGAKSIFGGAQDLADTVDSFQELYTEVNSDGQVSESGRRIIEEVEDIVDSEKQVKHSQMQKKIEGNIEKEQWIKPFLTQKPGVASTFLEYPLPILIQSGSGFTLNKFNV